jgi:hypothetical protein
MAVNRSSNRSRKKKKKKGAGFWCDSWYNVMMVTIPQARTRVTTCNGKEERTCRAHPFNSTDAQHAEVSACTVSDDYCSHALGPVTRLSARFVGATLGEGETLFVSSPLQWCVFFCRDVASLPASREQQQVVRSCDVGSRPLRVCTSNRFAFPWTIEGGGAKCCQISARTRTRFLFSKFERIFS